ncbi:hypothetical protein BGZ98_005935, partial [Dissophora globulifera]
TGATDTCIRKDIAVQHNVTITPAEGVIILADESKMIRRIGRTENVDLTYGDRVVSSTLEVIEQSYPFIIGMDLFHEFGLGIVGLVNPGDDTTTLSEPERDHKPSLIPGKQPDEESTAEFIKAKEQFMAGIKNALDDNAEIPKESYCPVPEMKVYLPVPKDVVLYRRSRPFAERQKSILDETVEKWSHDDVITLAPVGN